MSVYLIHAFEDMYSGLHGIESYDIIETDSKRVVEETAREMSLDVMDYYSSIGEDLYAEALEQAEADGYEEGSEEFEDLLDDCYNDNVAYEYWKLDDKLTYEQYHDMLDGVNGSWEEIRDKYAVS